VGGLGARIEEPVVKLPVKLVVNATA